MVELSLEEAKVQLSELLQRVEAGEEIVISRAEKPVARLVPVGGPLGPRVLDRHRGEIVVQDDFEELPEDLLNHFR